MTKVLLIDDLRSFRQVPSGVDVTIARTSQAALNVLAQDLTWDEVWLDHDLGEDAGRTDSIMRVVDNLCELAYTGADVQIGRIRVHTSNPVGGDTMMRGLQHYGYQVERVDAARFFTVEV